VKSTSIVKGFSKLLIVLTVVIGGTAAMGTPALATANTCENFFFPGYYLCENLSGSGLHIDYLHAAATFQAASGESMSVHIQIWGPNGTIKNCSEVTIHGGQTTTCQWSPNRNEPAGNYGFTVWQKLSSGWGNDGDIWVGVHS